MGASTRERRRRTGLVVMMLLWCCCRSSSFAPTSSAFLGGKLGTSAARRARPSTSHAASPSAVAAPSMKSRGRGKRAKVKRVWRRSSLHAAEFKDKLGHGVWDKFKVPPDGRAHDEVTFRSGCEGRTLTIPQGVVAVCTCRLCLLAFFVEWFGGTDVLVYGRSFLFRLFVAKNPRVLSERGASVLVLLEHSVSRVCWCESVQPVPWFPLVWRRRVISGLATADRWIFGQV